MRSRQRSEAKYCGECGAPLAARCGSCEAEQPPGAKFCNRCGSPIAATAAPNPNVDHQPPVSSAVRKNVTALFGDLVGSTAFGERVDPEAAPSALAQYLEILRSTIEDHAGTVVEFTGDGVMVTLGVPEPPWGPVGLDLRTTATDLVAAIPDIDVHRARGAMMDRHEIVALTLAALDDS